MGRCGDCVMWSERPLKDPAPHQIGKRFGVCKLMRGSHAPRKSWSEFKGCSDFSRRPS